MNHRIFGLLLYGLTNVVAAAPGAEFATIDEGIVGTYRKAVPNIDVDTSKAKDEGNKPRVAQRQRQLLEERYDLGDRPSNIQMSGGRKYVQEGVGGADVGWNKLGEIGSNVACRHSQAERFSARI